MAWHALILEDDPLRVVAMRRVLGALMPSVAVAVFDAVPPFRAFVREHGHGLVLVSLDCDLTRPCPDYPGVERGDGRDASEFLAALPAVCPVIVHSSNYGLVPFMMQKLRDGGWETMLVTPHSDPEYAWVDGEWRGEVERLVTSGQVRWEPIG
jgi:hypothetical protein